MKLSASTSASAPALLIRGQVMHERLRPARNRFVYPVFYVRLNLSRLDELNSPWFGIDRWRPVSLRTRDYGPRDGSSLTSWMRATLADAGIEADGEIWLQTFPRIFGFVFNPVSFWYCYDQQEHLRAVLAEVNNTFGETHRYLLAAKDNSGIEAHSIMECKKSMHVSPFCEVRGVYRFRFRDTPSSTFVGIDYHDDDGLLIKTAIGGHVHILQSQQIARVLMRQPFLTLGIVARILWQALKLWTKRVPFFYKPEPPGEPVSTQEEPSS